MILPAWRISKWTVSKGAGLNGVVMIDGTRFLTNVASWITQSHTKSAVRILVLCRKKRLKRRLSEAQAQFESGDLWVRLLGVSWALINSG